MEIKRWQRPDGGWEFGAEPVESTKPPKVKRPPRATNPRPAKPRPEIPISLSPREQQIALRLCAPDEPTVEMVSAELGLSIETGKSYIKRIHAKLGVRSKIGIFHHLLSEGMITK